MQKTRYGAYGVIIKNDTLLLTQKKSGPYIHLWGLPGGSIELGESPEEAVIREILEETGMQAQGISLKAVYTTLNPFHHVGIIYDIDSVTPVEDMIGEEQHKWFPIQELEPEMLTPFAIKLLTSLGLVNRTTLK